MVMDEPLAGVDLHSQAGLAQLLGGLRDAASACSSSSTSAAPWATSSTAPTPATAVSPGRRPCRYAAEEVACPPSPPLSAWSYPIAGVI